jgi:hypothetical protein
MPIFETSWLLCGPIGKRGMIVYLIEKKATQNRSIIWKMLLIRTWRWWMYCTFCQTGRKLMARCNYLPLRQPKQDFKQCMWRGSSICDDQAGGTIKIDLAIQGNKVFSDAAWPKKVPDFQVRAHLEFIARFSKASWGQQFLSSLNSQGLVAIACWSPGSTLASEYGRPFANHSGYFPHRQSHFIKSSCSSKNYRSSSF